VLPPVLHAVIAARAGEPPAGAIVLVKPQFEAGREHVGKGGIVRDAAAQEAALEKVRACLTGLGAGATESRESPILGAEGNREFLLYAEFGSVLNVR
jgi:23S rRNA (cytidine1920-2'-O)/16S rRNA (cytidine1409-2'-O)-methyltransferase